MVYISIFLYYIIYMPPKQIDLLSRDSLVNIGIKLQINGFTNMFTKPYKKKNELNKSSPSNKSNDEDNPVVPVDRNEPCPCGSGEKYKHCHGNIDPNIKVGRNEPCPCRSGKKYKHCHGGLA